MPSRQLVHRGTWLGSASTSVGKCGLMQLLVPAAVAALVAAVALSAGTPAGDTPVVATAGPRSATAAGSGTVSETLDRTPAALPARAASRRRFVWPLSPLPTVHRRFEPPPSPWSPAHRGVDLLAAVGQPVLSAGEGVVAFSGVVAGRGVVTVAHSGGLRTTYEPVDERLAAGTVVHRGSRVGVVSATAGHCAPLTCVHWGAISAGVYRDPLSLLGFGRPVLLPLG